MVTATGTGTSTDTDTEAVMDMGTSIDADIGAGTLPIIAVPTTDLPWSTLGSLSRFRVDPGRALEAGIEF